MKKIRLYLYITLISFAVLFILGTFLDEQINAALFSNKNYFGLIISVIGTTPGYGMMSIIGGGFLALGLRKDYNKWLRVFFFVATAACLALPTYFAGREFFGRNGFYWVASKFWGYFIAFPCMVGFTYLGYILIRKVENKDIWILLLVLLVSFTVALIGGVTLFKVIFHRPRFRAVVGANLDFYPWYVRCSDYEILMDAHNLLEEEFKSFPSGHAATSMGVPLILVFLPIVDQKYLKYRLPLFIGGLVFSLLVMFCRMLVGAHYLSDVSMGAMITTICMIAGSEVLRATKKLSI